jgi:ribosome-binding ATPase YchF (GTP1/OBG family)
LWSVESRRPGEPPGSPRPPPLVRFADRRCTPGTGGYGQEDVPLDVGIVGLPGAGKTTLFTALTGVSPTTYGQEHVGMAEIPDERLGPIAEVEGSAKTTPATVKLVDPPGLSARVLGELRKADALIAVLRNFGADADPDHDLETIGLELVVADRDHVEKRLERVRTQAKSGDPRLREEAAELERVLAHVEDGHPLRTYEGALPSGLEPLTTKPLVRIVNGSDGGIDLKLEAELSELPPEEAVEFREGPSGLEEVLSSLFETAGLLTFFTGGDKETHAWTLRHGQTALDAAATIHTDIARGFIRCEVIGWRDLVEAGSRAEAARRGHQRLEGKEYVVADGDVLHMRFNV